MLLYINSRPPQFEKHPGMLGACTNFNIVRYSVERVKCENLRQCADKDKTRIRIRKNRPRSEQNKVLHLLANFNTKTSSFTTYDLPLSVRKCLYGSENRHEFCSTSNPQCMIGKDLFLAIHSLRNRSFLLHRVVKLQKTVTSVWSKLDGIEFPKVLPDSLSIASSSR